MSLRGSELVTLSLVASGLLMIAFGGVSAQTRDQFRGPWVVTEDSTVAIMVEDTTQRTVLMYGDTIYVHTRETAEIFIAKINDVDHFVPSSVLVLPSRFIPKVTTKKAGGPPPRRDVTLRVGAEAGTALWLGGGSMDPRFSYGFDVDVALSGANVYVTAAYQKIQFSYEESIGWLGWPETPESTVVFHRSYSVATVGLHVGFVATPVDLVPYIHPVAGWVFREYDPFFVAGVGLGADYYITTGIIVTAELAPYMKFDRWGRDWWALPIRAGLKVVL